MHILFCGIVALSQQVGDDMSVYVSCRDAQDLTSGDMEAFSQCKSFFFLVLESPKFLNHDVSCH